MATTTYKSNVFLKKQILYWGHVGTDMFESYLIVNFMTQKHVKKIGISRNKQAKSFIIYLVSLIISRVFVWWFYMI